MQDVFALLFWISAAAVVYAYLGYPLLIWCLARRFGSSRPRRTLAEADLPKISLLIAAYNEERVIEERLRNALALDYPADKLEIIIASDGSTDGTTRVVKGFAHRGVRLLDYSVRRGKASVLNSSFPELKGDVILLSDANTEFDRLAARNIVRWFADPHIGVVCGRLVLVDPETGQNADSLYWEYETFLKKCEGQLRALLGANGGIYAIRRHLFQPIPSETIVDDFVIPLQAKLRTGCAIIYDWPQAPELGRRVVRNREGGSEVVRVTPRRKRRILRRRQRAIASKKQGWSRSPRAVVIVWRAPGRSEVGAGIVVSPLSCDGKEIVLRAGNWR